MATQKLHTFEGWANGATITAGGTGSGDPVDAPVLTLGSTATATTTTPIRGSVSGLLTLTSGASGYFPMSLTAPADRIVGQFSFRYEADPVAAPEYIVSTRTTASANSITAYIVNTTKRLAFVNLAGGTLSNITSSVWPALVVGNVYRVDFAATKGTTTANGRIEVKITNLTTSTVLITYDDSTNNTGTDQFSSIRFGRFANVSETYSYRMDDLQVGDMASGFFGVPGTVVLSATVAVVPATGPIPLTVTATASAVGLGTTTTYAFDWGDGQTTSAQSSPVASHTYASAGTFIVTVTVTTN